MFALFYTGGYEASVHSFEMKIRLRHTHNGQTEKERGTQTEINRKGEVGVRIEKVWRGTEGVDNANKNGKCELDQ